MVVNALQMPQYYLYRHIRLDTNEIFYVGVGKRGRDDFANPLMFTRAYTKKGRNKHWLNIVAKTEYEIEIIFESDSAEHIREKEMEFISLYGRKDLGKGTLVNFTDGGDGITGAIRTSETRKKLSEAKKGALNPQFGKTRSKEWSDFMSKRLSGEGNPNYRKPLSERQKEINRQAQLGRKCSKERAEKQTSHFKKPIINTNTGTIYTSIREAALLLNKPENTIGRWVKLNLNGFKRI
jgi:group I intron endonuclease